MIAVMANVVFEDYDYMGPDVIRIIDGRKLK